MRMETRIFKCYLGAAVELAAPIDSALAWLYLEL